MNKHIESKLYNVKAETENSAFNLDFHILADSALKAGKIAQKEIDTCLDIYKECEIIKIELLANYNIVMEVEDGN